MKRIWLPLALALLSGCAHLGAGSSRAREEARLWDEAHLALATGEFQRADSLFSMLARDFPDSTGGRESHFYLGALSLDPRNPKWNPEPAEAHLRRYLAADTTGPDRTHRRPEGEILFQLARQLNLPAEERISALQPETRVVRVPQRIVTYRESEQLAKRVEELRRQVESKDAQLRRQEEELERIRKTLTGRRQ